MVRNELRKHLEDMFPKASGEDINTVMDLMIIASQVEPNLEADDE